MLSLERSHIWRSVEFVGNVSAQFTSPVIRTSFILDFHYVPCKPQL